MNKREASGRQASVDGLAHEHIVVGILMKKYMNVSLVDLHSSPYDIIIVRDRPGNDEDIIRAQVKTALASVSFTGGSRGGVDRVYRSGVKTYRQSTKTSDVVIGINPTPEGSFDLFFVPTKLIEVLNQSSISIKKIEPLKNNYEMLERCKDHRYVIRKCTEYGIIGRKARSRSR